MNVAAGRRWSLVERAAIVFTFVYMSVWLVAATRTHNREFVFYFVVMCALIAAVGLVHARVRFHPLTLWGLSLWGLAHMAGGLLPIPAAWPRLGDERVLYNLWIVPGRLKYDQLVHAYGFGLVTWVCWQGLERAATARGAQLAPTFGLLVLCAAGGMGFGALNEVVEFIAVLTLPGTNVGGYENTGWDLVANLCGASLAAALIRTLHRPKAPDRASLSGSSP